MSSNCIKLYMDGLYTQRDFHRVNKHLKRSSDEKVMVLRSWRPRMDSAAGQLRGTHAIAFPGLL